MKVLIVDDSSVMRRILIRELAKLGITEDNISEAEDGKQGVDSATTGHFDLILMDWNMPVMLGIDAVKAIREVGVKTPILMVTTESERTNVVAAIQAGANNYLVKPFVLENFKEKIVQLTGMTA